ncbi:MAG: hypothetical protein OYG31_02865 [Candidatus Kaiserbacteria bacterium]|nr:hypothetical protein [Candidatus Kaiserbacteria bacterium]
MSLTYTDLRPGVFFRMDGDLYETISTTVSKKSRQKGSAQARLKHLTSGAVVSKTVRPSDRLEEVSLTKKTYIFIYQKGGEAVIHPEGVPSDRITVPVSGDGYRLIPSGQTITALLDGDDVVSLMLPIKVVVSVTDAPPSIRGNTTQGGSKRVTVETGASVTVPLFIEAGDRIVVKPAEGTYIERAR